MEAAASVWGAVKTARPALELVHSVTQRGPDSTAQKIVDAIKMRILDAEPVERICREKGWLKVRKDLTFTVNFAQETLQAMIANCLGKTCDYKMYQASRDECKETFRADVTTALTAKLLEHINPDNAVGEEQEYLFSSEKTKVIAQMTFTPLSKDAVQEAVSKAAKSAGFFNSSASA